MDNELEKILAEIKDDKKISLQQINYFIQNFNDRFWRALQNFCANYEVVDTKLENILAEIKSDKNFSLQHLKFFIQVFNDRFWRALQNLLSSSVKKYVFHPSNRVEWIVVGKTRDYLIISNLYCSCDDFYVKVVVQKNAKMCYHLLSKLLGEALGNYEQINVEDERYDELMRDWKQL